MKTFEIYTESFSLIIQANNMFDALQQFISIYHEQPITILDMQSPAYLEFIGTHQSNVPLQLL